MAQRIFAAILGFMALLCTPVFADEAESGQLTVTGIGQVDAVPDIATITLGVSYDAETAAEALAAMSEATESLLSRLQTEGLAERDVQTSNLSLQPIWDNRSSSSTGPQTKGYTASTQVTVRVRALDDLGRILDRAVQDGANQLHGLQFGLSDPGPILDQARVAAVVEARRRAELYAQAAGVTLGQVQSLNEGGQQGGHPMNNARVASMAESVPVAAGELTLSASVTMVFSLEPSGN